MPSNIYFPPKLRHSATGLDIPTGTWRPAAQAPAHIIQNIDNNTINGEARPMPFTSMNGIPASGAAPALASSSRPKK
jgi:hypothetical protein